MKIRVTPAVAGQVRVVPEVSVGRVSVMEGYNGVGKSALVRILQICCGVIPYREGDRPWNSLRQALGEVRVEVLDLADGDRIEWQFNSREWIDRKGPIATDWFRRITVNGHSSGLDDVRSLLGVYRVAGDESVVETLARQTDAYQDAVGRWLDILESGERQAVSAEAARDLELLAAQAGAVDIAVLAADQESLARSRAEADQAESRRRSKAESVQRLREAVDTARLLAELREQGPGMDARISAVVKALRTAESERADLIREAEDAAGSARLGEGVQRDLGNAQRTLSRNREKLQDASVRLSAALQPHGLPADPAAVDAALQAAERDLDDLSRRKTQADAVPAVRRLLGDLVARLDTAVFEGLGEQSLVNDEPGRPSSATYYRDRFAERREAIRDLPPAPEAAQIERRLVDTARRVAALRELPQLFDAVEQYRRRTSDNTERVTVLSSSPELGASARLQQLQARRTELDEKVLSLASQQARMVRQKGLLGGGQDELVLASTSRQLLAGLELEDADELPAALAAAEAELEQAGRHATVANQSLERATAASAAHERGLAASREALWSQPAFAWFRQTHPSELPDPDTDREAALARLTDLAWRARSGANRLRMVRNQAIAIHSALGAIANRLRDREGGAVEYVEQLSRWLSIRFAQYFAQDSLRQALLPEGAADLAVDLDGAVLSWTVNGERDEKPLDAFSSGQQAYLYTRARLALLDEVAPPRNRLLCLDEFGAFMDDDRRGDLYDYLLMRASTHPLDSVLLILPVRQDYATGADNAVGRERARLLAMAEELALPAGVAVRDVESA